MNKLAESFLLKDLTPDQFKCLMFIQGIHDPRDKNIRTRLLNIFDKTEKKCVLREMMDEAERILRIESDTTLGNTTSVNQLQRPANNQQSKGKSFGKKQLKSRTSGRPSDVPPSPCWQCGDMHYVKDCKYSKHKCTKCNVVGHKKGYCSAPKNKKKVNVVQLLKSSPAVMSTSSVPEPDVKRRFVYVLVNGISISLELDSAADVTLITESTWRTIGAPVLQRCPTIPEDAQNNVMPIKGKIDVTVTLDDQVKSLSCLVTGTDKDLFGIDWISAFNLWAKPMSSFCNQITTPSQAPSLSASQVDERVQQLKSKFSDVFEPTLGRCKDVLVSLKLVDGAKETFRPKRPVPFHAQQRVHEELERLEQSGIITPISFSKFAAPIVVVAKPNGSVRLVGDYSTGLNASLQPHQYPIPTPERIFASLSKCVIFTQIDLSDAYLQLEVDEESRKLLTINTSKGLFTFNRLCPGVKPAAGIFQQTMDTIL